MEHGLVLIGSVRSTVRDSLERCDEKSWVSYIEPILSTILTLELRAEEQETGVIDIQYVVLDTLFETHEIEDMEAEIIYEAIMAILRQSFTNDDKLSYDTRIIVQRGEVYLLSPIPEPGDD